MKSGQGELMDNTRPPRQAPYRYLQWLLRQRVGEHVHACSPASLKSAPIRPPQAIFAELVCQEQCSERFLVGAFGTFCNLLTVVATHCRSPLSRVAWCDTRLTQRAVTMCPGSASSSLWVPHRWKSRVGSHFQGCFDVVGPPLWSEVDKS